MSDNTSHVVGTTFRLYFTSRIGDGTPTTILGAPAIAAYYNGVATPVTLGITLTVDYSGISGFNMITIDSSLANGFINDTHYALTMTAGTVGGITIAGETMKEFSLYAPRGSWLWNTGIADSDPGTGNIKFNNIDPTLATFVYANNITAENRNAVLDIKGFRVGDVVKSQLTGSGGIYAAFTISGVPTTGTNYMKIPVVYLEGAGTYNDNGVIDFDLLHRSSWSAQEMNEVRGRLGITGTTAIGGNVPTLALEKTVVDLNDKNWLFNTDTSATNPTLNNIKVNNADPTLVTQIYVNNLAANGRNSITDILSLELGDTVMMQVDGVGNTYMNFIVNGAITDNGTWKTIPVSYDSNLGTILLGDLLNVEFNFIASGTDWTVTERDQMRYRFGLDGATNTPIAVPDLALESTVSLKSSQTSVDGIANDTNTLIPSQINAVLADTGTNLPTQIGNLNDFDPATQTVNAFVQGFLTTLLTELTAGRITGNFDTFFENADAVTAKVVDDVGGGGAGGTDWTVAERNQMRYRFGLDGTTAVPAATPDLALEATVASKSSQTSVDTKSSQVSVDAIKAETALTKTDTTNIDVKVTDLQSDAGTYDPITDSNEAIRNAIDALVTGGFDWTVAERSEIRNALGVTGAILPLGRAPLLALEATIVNLNDFDPLADSVANVALVAVTTLNTDMRGTEFANTIAPDNAGIADIQARVPATLVNGKMDSDVTAIANSLIAAANLSESAKGIKPGLCTGVPTLTNIPTDLTVPGSLVGRNIIFITGLAVGAIDGEATAIIAHTGNILTVTTLSLAPAAGDAFVVV